jgi:alanine dehydrogenase
VIVGVPKEIKNRENRVGILPTGVRALVAAGHKVLVQRNAGLGSGITNEAYEAAGARLVDQAAEAWGADMVVKVKEPLADEFTHLRPGQILFTYLHLAAEKRLTEELIEKKVTAIAYETIQEPNGNLPLLRPMSEVAGRMSVQVGAYYLQSSWGSDVSGRGVLLGGVPGVLPGKVAVIGGGVAGCNAAQVALGMGAVVTILDIDPKRLEYLDHVLGGRCLTLMSNIDNIDESVAKADLVIGSVLVPGARAPKLVTEKTVSKMSPGSVIVDIAVDQGGCVETCRPTSHESPTFVKHGVIHYCVTNMPGAVARTSTFALTNVTLGYALKIANKGPEQAAREHGPLRLGFNTVQGKLVHEYVASAHGLPFTKLEL